MDKIYQTEASIIKDILGRHKGKITKLAGAIGECEIKLYLTLESFRNFHISLIPTLKIELTVDASHNIISLTTNKNISPLKKGDIVTFHLDDNSYFQVSLMGGKVSKGKGECVNFIIITDLQLIHLTQLHLTHISIQNVTKIQYDFINIANLQYSGVYNGRCLFQIMCERLVGIKKIMMGIQDHGTSSENFNNHTTILLPPNE